MVRTFAAIDVGSFELELGIYEITDKGNVRTVDQVKHMIALGKDTYNTGKISYRLVEEMCQVASFEPSSMKQMRLMGPIVPAARRAVNFSRRRRAVSGRTVSSL